MPGSRTDVPGAPPAKRMHPRRAVLGAAVAALGAAAAQSLRPDSAGAAPTNIQTETDNSAAARTKLLGAIDNQEVFWVQNTSSNVGIRQAFRATVGLPTTNGADGTAIVGASDAGNSPVGVQGEANVAGGTGVRGLGTSGFGVYGLATAGGTGVQGTASGDGGTGVLGSTTGSSGIAVYGLATNAASTAVWAENSAGGTALRVAGNAQLDAALTVGSTVLVSGAADFQSSVTAQSFNGSGFGLFSVPASSLTGIVSLAKLPPQVVRTNSPSTVLTGSLSAASLAGPGGGLTGLNASNLGSGTVPDARLSAVIVRTTARSTAFTGTVAAKKYTGPSNGALALAGSGIGTVPRGEDNARIVNPLCMGSSKVLVTLQGNPGDAAVKYVKPGKGFFDLFLTAPVGAPTKVAYLVLA